MSSVEPEQYANQRHRSKECVGEFVVAGRDRPVLLELAEEALDEVSSRYKAKSVFRGSLRLAFGGMILGIREAKTSTDTTVYDPTCGSGLHKRDLWLGNAQALVDGISLRKVAKRLGVHVETAFRWRHRFLKAPKTLKPQRLEGTVEADETYFLKSEKGTRKLSRPARKRGGKAAKRGLSDEQVPVLIARDTAKATTDQMLADRSAKSIAEVLAPVVTKQAILVSDGAQAYRSFANEAAIVHVALNLSEGQRSWGVYHIQNVNNYCSRLTTWMRRFNGVATKYLDSYLGWHRNKDREGDSFNAKGLLFAAWS